MKPQKSIIKELKTYQQDLYKSGREGKQFSISDFPNISRKPIEWTDCDQFIKLRQQKCDKKLAIRLCQQYKIHRSQQQFYETLHNVNMENVGFKKIQSSTSFLLRQIRQNQFVKQKFRMEFQETQIENKMSTILDNSFQKFQKSLDKHLEIEKDQSHKFNLKYMTKEELYSKLQKLQIISKFKKSYSKIKSIHGSFSNYQFFTFKFIKSFRKFCKIFIYQKVHISQTERMSSKQFIPYSTVRENRESNASIKQQFTKLQNYRHSNPSFKIIKQNQEVRASLNFQVNLTKEIKSMQLIGNQNDIPETKKVHKRHLTNYDITGNTGIFQQINC
ncbi:unnamed protein product [Paramecium sonneborni]|uniref:Uncharacterized protein n=1 Tax=Paramecium sonneborni TaxID=65129 RepID=A0A8S1MMN3_9CILI|nr:unnamed protein product [Paramecium sonneborni]